MEVVVDEVLERVRKEAEEEVKEDTWELCLRWCWAVR